MGFNNREPLDERQKASLDGGLLKYLHREARPVEIHSVLCHAELHTCDEIMESLGRLREQRKVRTFDDRRRGPVWLAIMTEDECPACEVLRTTYQNPTRIMHMCVASDSPSTPEDGGNG